MQQRMYPSAIQTSNGTTDLFTVIFYIIRILGIGQGLIQPSPVESPNGGYYLEQNIFANSDESDSSSFWFFEKTSTPGFYQWGSKSKSNSRVFWTTGETEKDDYPLELRNISDATEEIYEDPTSAFWEFDSYDLQAFGYFGIGYKLKPLNLQGIESSPSATFATSPKSPQGWWLQVNQHNEPQKSVDRWTADYLFVLEPTHFKLYSEISHMDLGEVDKIVDSPRVQEYLVVDRILENPLPNDTRKSVTINGQVLYNVDVSLDKKFDIFSGITVINPNTNPSWKYFDLENTTREEEWSVNLKSTADVTLTEELELEPFSKKNVSGYVTYLKEFHGLRYYSYAEVTAVADVMGNHGQVLKNVLVTDVNLLKYLIRTKGYRGKFWESKEKEPGCAKIRIRVEGVLRGSLPIPFIQIEEGTSQFVPQFQKDHEMAQPWHLS